MKRVIVGLAIVLGCIAAQASVVKWSVLNVQDSPSAAASESWMVAIFEGVASSFDFDAFASGTLTAADVQSPVKNATTGFLNVNNTSGFGDYTAGSSQSFYAVIFDAATLGDVRNYIVSESVEKTFAANGSAQTWAFGNMGLTTSANKFANSSWQAVPEPTSGLLMLIGLAGLALRRRRS